MLPQSLARILSRARASRNRRQAAINIALATLRRGGDYIDFARSRLSRNYVRAALNLSAAAARSTRDRMAAAGWGARRTVARPVRFLGSRVSRRLFSTMLGVSEATADFARQRLARIALTDELVTSLQAANLPVNFQRRSVDAIERDVAYAIQVGVNQLRRCRTMGLDLDGIRLLELGPGVNFGPQLIFATHGAEVTLADRFLAPWQPSYHPFFYSALTRAWDGPKAGLERVVSQGSYDGVLTLVDQPAEAMTAIADESMDLVISNAVLEHVYDLAAVAAELARVTRPGGLGAHQIDFRDHADFSRPLEFLLEERDAYARIFEEIHGDRGNRLRPDEAARAFEAAGFEILDREVNGAVEDAYLQDFLPRLRASPSPYADYDAEALRPLGVCLTMRKT